MLAIEVKNIKKFYGVNEIIKDISFLINEGEKVAFVGQNGCGKTTLFKILKGIEEIKEGSINIKKGLSVGYLDQIPTYDEKVCVKDVMHNAFAKLYDINDKMKELQKTMTVLKDKELQKTMDEYAELQHIFEIKDGYKIEESISRISNGFGFTNEFLNKEFNSLSGGEKTKVILSKILLEAPDILLLDEPTNHLDVGAVEWLEDFIKSYKGTALIISHDRYFLDKVVDKVIEIEGGCGATYSGNYTWYVEEKEKRILDQLSNYNNQQKQIKQMEEAKRRFRDWAQAGGAEKMYKKMHSMEKRLERVERMDKPKIHTAKMRINFSETIRTGNDVLEIIDYEKTFNENKLFEVAGFKLNHLDSAAIMGANGCGKSTIIKSILNEYIDRLDSKKRDTFPYIKDIELYKKDAGVIKLGTNIKLAYLDQNIHFNDEEHTVLEEFRENLMISETDARNMLAKFLFRGDSVFNKVKSLSGGEKTRLRLCQLMQHDINFLILDEPTNHLDIDSKEVLEQALVEFEGTLLFISHDRYFINKIASKILEVENKTIKCYDGNYEFYKSEKEKQNRRETAQETQKEITTTQSSYIKGVEERAKAKRKKSLEDKIYEIEKNIEKLENDAHECGNEYEKIKEIFAKKVVLQSELDLKMEEWLSL